MSVSSGTRKPLVKILDEVEYFPHQLEGVRHLIRTQSHILGDEMGLGKSLQILTVAAAGFEVGELKHVLVVAPASIKENWADECDEFTRFTYHILDGTPKQRERQLDEFWQDILIVNYEQVVKHWERINQMGFGMFVYDEGHMLGGHNTKMTKAVHLLRGPRHFILTGSPLMNQVDRLWSILNRIDPVAFPNYYRFVNRYAVYGGYKDKQIVGIKNEDELRDHVQQRMLRREKKDKLDLPGKRHVPVKVEMTDLQRRLYKQMKEDLFAEAPDLEEEGGILVVPNPMQKSLRLKQICASTAYLPGQPDQSPKLDEAARMCAEFIEKGEPVVVFTQFRDVQVWFAERLDKYDVDYRFLHGDVKRSERTPIVRRWSEDAKAGKPQVLICMYQVAGVGLNMVASNTCILLDKLYEPELVKQAEDRLDRIGQTRPVTIFDMQMRNSIDTRINAILKQKGDIFSKLIATDHSAWKAMLMAAVMADSDEEAVAMVEAAEAAAAR